MNVVYEMDASKGPVALVVKKGEEKRWSAQLVFWKSAILAWRYAWTAGSRGSLALDDPVLEIFWVHDWMAAGLYPGWTGVARARDGEACDEGGVLATPADSYCFEDERDMTWYLD